MKIFFLHVLKKHFIYIIQKTIIWKKKLYCIFQHWQHWQHCDCFIETTMFFKKLETIWSKTTCWYQTNKTNCSTKRHFVESIYHYFFNKRMKKKSQHKSTYNVFNKKFKLGRNFFSSLHVKVKCSNASKLTVYSD